MLFWFCLIAGLIQIERTYQQVNVTVKCCEESFEVEETINGTLECRERTNLRHHLVLELHNTLNTSDGVCIDTNGSSVVVYHVNNSVIVQKDKVSSFPKCCPLKHAYTNKTRSCMPSDDPQDFINDQSIKIGLPHCKIITDNVFYNQNEASTYMLSLDPSNSCMDRNVNGGYVVRICKEDMIDEICANKRCFLKCCNDGQSYVGGGTCKDTFVHGLQIDAQHYSNNIEDIEDDYELVHVGCTRVHKINPNFQYTIKKGGEFSYYYNLTKSVKVHTYDEAQYCLEHAQKGSEIGYNLFWCMKNTPLAGKFKYTLWAKILSCICMAATVLLYLYLGELRSTFGKTLINYCIVMTLLFTVLVAVQLDKSALRLECKIRALTLIFFQVASFAWVNVISWDIWYTFGKPTITIGRDQRKRDLKKFVLYFLYGYGLPLCHMLLLLLFDLTRILPDSIQPYFGEYKCFLEDRKDNYGRIVWFVVPTIIHQLINIVLFVKTIIYCIGVKNEIKKMNDSNMNRNTGRLNPDMEKLKLVMKLAVIMGVVWTIEVVTSLINMPSYGRFWETLETILDNITCLQGVFVFLIFICKKQTMNNLKNKLRPGDRRTSMSATTQASHINGHYPMNKRQTTMSMTESKF